ncbi:MAG: SHOCT domain-containing protein [Aliarcobacter sp.]|nr:SHOCT domain-containing protein [Aliarcobacter sp.]
MLKKIILASTISFSSLLAFDFSNAIDKVTNNVVDSISDKTSTATEKQIDSAFSEEKKASSNNKTEALRELAQMKKEGLITEEEYAQQKKVILNGN